MAAKKQTKAKIHPKSAKSPARKSNDKSKDHDKRLDNLRPIKPGESRNPKGFSAKGREKRRFKQWMAYREDQYEVVYDKLLEKAQEGDTFCMKEFLDRTEGKVPSKAELSGPGGKPLQANISVIDKTAQANLKKLIKKLSKS